MQLLVGLTSNVCVFNATVVNDSGQVRLPVFCTHIHFSICNATDYLLYQS